MRRFLTSLLVLTAALARAGPAEVYLRPEEALRLAFPEATLVSEHRTSFDAAQRASLRSDCGVSEMPESLSWWRFEKQGRCLGYACIDEVQGKAQPITFLLAADADLRIRSVEILAYRETHGGEVRRSDWRAQFVGKDTRSTLRVGRDVRNIAGATISCRNLTNGVRVRLAALARAVAHEPLTPPDAPDVVRVASESAAEGIPKRCQLLMGTTLQVQLDESDAVRATAALEAVFEEVRRLEQLLSDWRADSELARWNAGAGGELVRVGPELEHLLASSLELSRASAGAFDVSVGSLTRLWRRARIDSSTPQAAALASARALVGWQGIELEPATHRARLARPGAAVDLGGIAKGYALDCAARILRARGSTRALLDFGGQLLALDPPEGKPGWPVDLRDPRGGESPLLRFSLRNASISSSADDQLGIDLGGERISHILDPRSGAPVRGRQLACAVSERAELADAWSTAFFVLGHEAGLALAERLGLAALVLEQDGSLHPSPVMREFLSRSSR